MSEIPLVGGDLNIGENAVVRVEDTVRRPLSDRAEAVHGLLLHFESVGFGGAPRYLGVDERGREVLSYVEGEPALNPVPPDDAVVSGLGRLLRRMHDAQAGFRRWVSSSSRTDAAFPPSARWGSAGTLGGGGGGGVPRRLVSSHLPRSTGEVRVGMDVASRMLPWPSRPPRSSRFARVTRRKRLP